MKKRRRDDPIDSDHLDSDLEDSPSASRPTKKRKKSAHSSESDSSDSDRDSDSSPKKSRSSRKKDLSRLPFSSADVPDVGGGLVYRPIRQERIGLGWSQAPCGRCPVFEFCMDGGPVSPAGCKYFDGWFGMGIGE
jgi:DNA-directed RNA polymerase III subunit RPC6